MSGYSIVSRDEVPNFMEQYPGFGEMHFFARPADAEQVAFTWRTMPAGTGGKGSYGHRHRTQEEIYYVVSGEPVFKLGDDIVQARPHTLVRVAPEVYRSVHNDGPGEVELVICSPTTNDPEGELETTPDFWPVD